MMGIFHGFRGAKVWRKYLSEESIKKNFDPNIIKKALNKIVDAQKEVA